MVKTGRHLWALHPHVDNDLTLGERAADVLKARFGSWSFMGALNGFILAWCLANSLLPPAWRIDPYPFIALNLILSWLAAQQGGALQIATNRGDKKTAEVALATHENGKQTRQLVEQVRDLTEQQMTILDQQTQMLTEIKALRAEIGDAKGGEVE